MNSWVTFFLISVVACAASCAFYFMRAEGSPSGLEITIIDPVISGSIQNVRVPLDSIVGSAKLVAFDANCGCMGCFVNGVHFSGAPLDVSASDDCTVRLNLDGKEAGRHAFQSVLTIMHDKRKQQIPVRFLVNVLDGLIVSPNALDLRDNAPVEIQVKTDSPLHRTSIVHAEVIEARDMEVDCIVQQVSVEERPAHESPFQLATVLLRRRESDIEGHYRLRVTVEGNQLPAREIPFRLLGSSNRMKQSIRRLFLSGEVRAKVDFFPPLSGHSRDLVLISSPPNIDLKIYPRESDRTRVEVLGTVVGLEPVTVRLVDTEGENYEIVVESYPTWPANHKQE